MQKGFICVYASALLLCGAPSSHVSAQQAPARQPAAKESSGQSAPPKPAAGTASQKAISDLLEGKIRAAWKAFKDKDKKAYAEFLADDFMAVEEDGGGERTKTVVIREVGESVVHDYNVQLFRVDPIAPGAQLVTYENVIQFPPGAGVRFEKIFISEIWLKRAGEWKVWRYQATKVK